MPIRDLFKREHSQQELDERAVHSKLADDSFELV